jgi:glycosyltransferase involved in cell wall biosynthesis
VHAIEMPRRITPFRDLIALARLWFLLRRLHPDIVHSHTPKGGLLGCLAALLAGVPVRIYHIRGLPFTTATGGRRRLLRATERISCAAATRVLCVSHSVREQALAEGLCSAEKVAVLRGGSGNGVDADERFEPTRHIPAGRKVRRELGISVDAIVIGFVGRIVRDKGVVELTAAWQSLSDANDQLWLLLVGPFEDEDAVPTTTRATLEAHPRVRLTETAWEIPPFYAAMDIVCLPSYREGFPNVPLEAGAMGLPVVATRIPGCTDAVVDGTTGLLVPPRDPRSLEAALRRYVDDPELRIRHGTAARQHVLALFRQEALWAALLAEYRRLLDPGTDHVD